MKILKYDHNGSDHPMTFINRNDQLMVNATELAKPFGKLVAGFLRTNHAKSFIKAYQHRSANLHNGFKPLEIIKGGNNKANQGTWMCEQLATKFAAWLAPEFELWVYDQIQELLSKGKVELKKNEPLSLANHIYLEIQKQNSKSINNKAYVERDKNVNARNGIIKYNVESCKIHTGLTPKQLKFAGKKFGYKSKDRCSAKQVVRKLAPEVACQMSLTDYIISSSDQYTTEDVQEVYNTITIKSEDLYKSLIASGINPKELNE